MANLALISSLFDQAEKRYRLTSLSADAEGYRSSCVPTGQLMLDACLGGGLPSGRWITVYGGEGSAKSTTMQTCLHAFGRLGIPGSYFDFEGSLEAGYLSKIIRTIGQVRAYESEGEDVVTKLFGLKGKGGKWVVPPLYRLYNEGVGDTFFNLLAEILRMLPDKVQVDGKWYLVYKERPSEGKVDRTLSARGAYYVEEPNGLPQLVEIIDSYPFMFPERLDTEDAGAGMAAVARMFSENIPKVAGKLRRKGVIIMGVNQTRLNPGVRYGSPEYEPAGQAVKFVSSVRISNAARSVPHGRGPVEMEDSVLQEGQDQYKYILTRLTKNKATTSLGIEFWQRLWAADPQGEAYGFDPVWDAWEFLGRTGQRSGTLKSSSLRILSADGTSVLYERAKFSLADLKHLMLLEGKDRVAYAKSLKMDKETYSGLFSGGKLHSHLHGQILEGTAQQLMYQTLNGVSAGLEENDDEDVEVEDDDVDEV